MLSEPYSRPGDPVFFRDDQIPNPPATVARRLHDVRLPRRLACFGVLLAALLTVAACGDNTGRAPVQTGMPMAGGPGVASAPTPVPVPGSERCTRLRQQAPATPAQSQQASEAWLAIRLPCLTSADARSLSRLRGPVLVNLWASWCGPCRSEMPVLAAAAHRYRGRVELVGVNTKDNPAAAAAFLTDLKVTYPQLVDTRGQLLAGLRIPGLPITLLLGPDGQLLGRHVGPLTRPSLDRFVTPILTSQRERHP